VLRTAMMIMMAVAAQANNVPAISAVRRTLLGFEASGGIVAASSSRNASIGQTIFFRSSAPNSSKPGPSWLPT
jgi:hypothetical protein